MGRCGPASMLGATVAGSYAHFHIMWMMQPVKRNAGAAGRY